MDKLQVYSSNNSDISQLPEAVQVAIIAAEAAERVARIQSRSRERIFFLSALATVVFSVCGVAFALITQSRSQSVEIRGPHFQARCAEGQAGIALRQAAGFGENVVRMVPNGTPVHLLEGGRKRKNDGNEWLHVSVQIANRLAQTGYCKADDVVRLENNYNALEKSDIQSLCHDLFRMGFK